MEREVYRRTQGDSYVQRMMHYDLQVILADNDLRKVNRMCELAGVRVRYPMLDEELVAFAARVPPSHRHAVGEPAPGRQVGNDEYGLGSLDPRALAAMPCRQRTGGWWRSQRPI